MISIGISMDAFYDYYDNDISMGQKDFFDSVVSMLEYFYTHTFFFHDAHMFICSEHSYARFYGCMHKFL